MQEEERRSLERALSWLRSQAEEKLCEYGTVSISVVFRAGKIQTIQRHHQETDQPTLTRQDQQ